MIEKYKGCMVGLACGDYLGMPVEFLSKENVEEYFGEEGIRPVDCKHRGYGILTAGHYTDDTAMTICLAESLIKKGFDVKDQFRRYRRWIEKGYGTPDNKAFGIGQNTLRTLATMNVDNIPTSVKDNIKMAGNGAIMRCAPLALMYYKNEKILFEKNLNSTIVTHNNWDAVWSCFILNTFIGYSLKGIKKENFIDTFIKKYSKDYPENIQQLLDFDFSKISIVPNNGYTLTTLVVALHSFFYSDNFELCIKKAISHGGDTDTQACVAGALAGAYYGYENIPKDWVMNLKNKDRIERISEKLYIKANEGSDSIN